MMLSTRYPERKRQECKKRRHRIAQPVYNRNTWICVRSWDYSQSQPNHGLFYLTGHSASDESTWHKWGADDMLSIWVELRRDDDLSKKMSKVCKDTITYLHRGQQNFHRLPNNMDPSECEMLWAWSLSLYSLAAYINILLFSVQCRRKRITSNSPADKNVSHWIYIELLRSQRYFRTTIAHNLAVDYIRVISTLPSVFCLQPQSYDSSRLRGSCIMLKGGMQQYSSWIGCLWLLMELLFTHSLQKDQSFVMLCRGDPLLLLL